MPNALLTLRQQHAHHHNSLIPLDLMDPNLLLVLAHHATQMHTKMSNLLFIIRNATGCNPCKTGMTYNVANKKCQCIDTTYV